MTQTLDVVPAPQPAPRPRNRVGVRARQRLEDLPHGLAQAIREIAAAEPDLNLEPLLEAFATEFDSDALLDRGEAAKLLGVSERFLERKASEGGGPRMVRLSPRAVRYFRRDLIRYAESLRVGSTAEEVGGHAEG